MALDIYSVQLDRGGVCEEIEPEPKMKLDELIQGLPADMMRKGDAT